MRDYKIILFGDPVLREKSHEIDKIDEDIIELADDMLRVMRANAGAGLAAQQIGHTERICVIDISGADMEDETGSHMGAQNVEMPLVMINPRIVDASGEQRLSEGCLSFPDVFVSMKRNTEVTVEYRDLQNMTRTVLTRGFLARAVQHELDHLDGVLMVDHMTSVQKIAISGKLKRIKSMSKKASGENESA